MKNLLNSIKLTRPKKNVFDLTHDVKLSCGMGQLVPVMCTEAVPSDVFNISAESLVRFAPMVTPVMHRFDVSIHYFFVPNRILWEGWEKFITNTTTEGLLPAHPQITYNGTMGAEVNKLASYLGLPYLTNTDEQTVSALPFAAYQKIFNEYYRDQNLQQDLTDLIKLNDGEQATPDALLRLRRRCWEHDYFTAALPWAQRGEAVSLPLGTVQLASDLDGKQPKFQTADGTAPLGDLIQDGVNPQGAWIEANGEEKLIYNPDGTLEVGSTTINDLRRAYRLQEWLERSARGGGRYVEQILSFFGIKPQDSRLQRPEYITGVKSPVMISEVLNTAGAGDLPQANMAGHGVGVTTGNFGKYFVQEHGFIIGIMSVMPKTGYFQGVHKKFLKSSPFDYFFPQFANIGEQEVLNKEVYAKNTDGLDNQTFGYVPRYAEYKFENNRVAGNFMTNLKFWHAAREFANRPQLNDEFVECFPTKRFFAVEDYLEDELFITVVNKVKAIRPMPQFGTPSF